MGEEWSYVIDDRTGDVIDSRTGEVVEERSVSMAYESRIFSAEDWWRRSRAGGRVTAAVHDYGLHTYVDDPRLGRLNDLVRVSHRDRPLVAVLSELWSMARRLGLADDIVEAAARILRRSPTVRSIGRGRCRRRLVALAAAAIYVASRLRGIPIRFRDLLTLGVSRRGLWNALKELELELGVAVQPLDPRVFVWPIVSRLGLSPSVACLASQIIAKLVGVSGLGGRDPASVAAAAVYVASIIANEKRTQRHVAEAAGVSEVSLRKRYREIVQRVSLVVRL